MSRSGRGAGDGTNPGGDHAARILAAARAAGCRTAELYIKTSASRQIAWEPPLVAGGAPHVAVTRAVEAGMGLRVEDPEGRAGMAWIGGGPAGFASPDEALAAGLVRDALAAAGASDAAAASGDPMPMAAREHAPSTASPDLGASTPAAAPSTGPRADGALLDLVDPECLDRPDAALVECLEVVAREVARTGEGVLEVDRILATEARTSVRLARLDGFDESYDRTIAALSVALVPAATGAAAVTEERSACRLADLDPLAAARDAVLRGLPPRGGSGTPSHPPTSKPRVVLAPRAAATLVAALAPWIVRGAIESARPSALSVVDDGRARGRPGSAPFDGSGAPTRRILLIDRGRAVGRINPDTGPFQRHSYRDLPAAGPACLVLLPGQRREDARVPTGSAETTSSGDGPDRLPEVRAAVVEVRMGAVVVVQIRRGDWESGDAADGLFWEGSTAALMAAVSATYEDLTWFQLGLPIAAPSIVIDCLGPWRIPGHEE